MKTTKSAGVASDNELECLVAVEDDQLAVFAHEEEITGVNGEGHERCTCVGKA